MKLTDFFPSNIILQMSSTSGIVDKLVGNDYGIIEWHFDYRFKFVSF